jgi:hypothetical protein
MPVADFAKGRTERVVREEAATRSALDGRTPVEKWLDYFSVGNFALVGTAEELTRRAMGRRPRPITKQITRAIEERKTFSSLTGDPIVGFGLDVVTDPLNFVPVGRVLSGVSKATRVPQVLRAVNKASDSVPMFRAIKDGIVEILPKRLQLARHNPDEILQLQNRYLNELEGSSRVAGERVLRELEDLVPDPARRDFLFKLLEDPVGPRLSREMTALNPNELKAFKKAQAVLRVLEDIKLKIGTLTQERVRGFLVKNSIPYVPRRFLTRDEALMRLRALEESLKSGDTVGAASARLEDVQTAIREIEDITEILPAGFEKRALSFYRGEMGLKPSYLFRRKTLGAVDDLPAILQQEVETDIAKLLGHETVQVARAQATKRYVDGMLGFMKKKGLFFTADEFANNPAAIKNTLKQAGRSESVVELKSLPSLVADEFRGGFVPRSIAKEVEAAVKGYSSPQFQQGVFQVFTRLQNMWKAHTLAIFPAYHIRNGGSNVWNNSLAGMDAFKDPRVLGDYKQAFNTLMAAKRGAGNAAKIINYKGIKGKLSEQDIIRLAKELRVIKAGELSGELGEVMGRMLHPKNLLKRLIDPASNPFIRRGFKYGQNIEDHSRLAHFMWRMRKGDDPVKAAKSVQKYLFDYTLGLPPMVQKFGRNFAFPFIAWSYFNIPLQFEMLLKYPTKFTRVRKLGRAIENELGGPEENDIYLEDWMKHAGGKVRWKFNKKTGDYEYFILDGWWPGADLRFMFDSQEARDEMLNMVSPFLKMPVELWFNYDLFRRRPVRDFPEKPQPVKGIGGLPVVGPIASEIKADIIGEKEKVIGIPLPARVAHVVRNFRLFNEIDRTLMAFDRDGFFGMMRRIGFGRASYSANSERQRKRWTFETRARILEMKKQRKVKQIMLERGDRRINPGDIENLDRLIQEAEDRLEEFK